MIEKVKVGYRTFDVIFEDNQHPTSRMTTSVGETHRHPIYKGKIYVDIAEDKVEEVNTFIHEVFHAIWSVYHMEEGDTEERIVNTMANGLTNVLLDNPEVLMYIRKRLKSA